MFPVDATDGVMIRATPESKMPYYIPEMAWISLHIYAVMTVIGINGDCTYSYRRV